MELGNQIKALRLRRGITQEALAAKLGVTPQAVSKWEHDTAAPDIAMLPDISAFFGVTIDQLFSLTDETRMERIDNMIWDVRFFDPAEVESSREFLLDKARREPENGRPYELLAEMENAQADQHRYIASEYAKTAIRRTPYQCRRSYWMLTQGLGGASTDWNYANHSRLIRAQAELIEEQPENWHLYMDIIYTLINDYRFEEAEKYWEVFRKLNDSYRVELYHGYLLWHSGRHEQAFHTWEELAKSQPDNWVIPAVMGEYRIKEGKYEEAKALFRHAMDVQETPKMCDPLDCIAQLCEIQGDYAGALAANRELLEVNEKMWNFTEGESIDSIHRDIARLEAKLSSQNA